MIIFWRIEHEIFLNRPVSYFKKKCNGSIIFQSKASLDLGITWYVIISKKTLVT